MEIPKNPTTDNNNHNHTKQPKKKNNTVITIGAGAGAGAIAIAIGSFVVVSALNFRRTKRTPPPLSPPDADEDESNDLGKKKKGGLHSLLHDSPLLSHHRIDGTRNTSVPQIDSTSIGNNESSILEKEFSVSPEADTHVVSLNKNTEDPFAVVQVIEVMKVDEEDDRMVIIESHDDTVGIDTPLKNLVEEERKECIDEKDISVEAEPTGVDESQELVLLVETESGEENKDFDREIIEKAEEEEAPIGTTRAYQIEESHGDDKYISGEGIVVELRENTQIQLVEKDAQQEDNGIAELGQIEVKSNPEMQLGDAKDKENNAETCEEKTQTQLVEETGQQDEYDQEKSEEESLEIAESKQILVKEDNNPETYLVETEDQEKTSESSEEEAIEIAATKQIADMNLVETEEDDDKREDTEQIAIERSPETYLVDTDDTDGKTVEIVQMNLVADEQVQSTEEEDEEDDIEDDDDDDEDDITDEEDHKAEENSSEGTGDSSMESNSDAIWPSEVIITHDFSDINKYPEAEKIKENIPMHYSESESESEEEIKEQGKSILVKSNNKGRIWSWSSMVVLLLVVVPVLLSLALTQSMKLGLVAFFIVLLSQFTKLHKLT